MKQYEEAVVELVKMNPVLEKVVFKTIPGLKNIIKSSERQKIDNS